MPADMHYHDFKRVFVDKTTTLKDWTAARGNDKISTTVKGITAETWRRSRKLSEPVTSTKDAKTFAEFQTYWAENYNVRVSDELRNLDFEAVQEAAEGIELVLKKFPAARGILKEFNIDSTYTMSTAYEGRINFHPERFKSKTGLEKLASADVQTGFHPKNTGIYEYGAHEAAHILIRALIDKYGGGTNDWNLGITARRIVRQAYASLKTEKSIHQCRREISKYASDYNKIDECITEAVSDCVANKENAAALSKAILNALGEELDVSD